MEHTEQIFKIIESAATNIAIMVVFGLISGSEGNVRTTRSTQNGFNPQIIYN